MTTTQGRPTLSLVLFLLVVTLSTSSTNAQRLRGVLKRPFHEIAAGVGVGVGIAGKSSLRGDTSDAETKDNDEVPTTRSLMEKMADFDELIWKMATTINHDDEESAVEAGNNNDDINRQRSLRWRKIINANEDSNDEGDESMEGPNGPWESCLQKDAIICMDHIKSLNDKLNAVILPYGSLVTMDFRADRVRIFVDENNVVKMTPRIS
eukprot:CAMPEP_0197716604 /NCGR_PEP_ID=MMETSP1434-20131217/1431_1 /TAXON_ID=265543 /ORGANISM="Minutocellus polymorphus, Strain CCMP3303" /LENGTH=207 /DNA_ID=CAMNT_0043300987 /DNA_START=75 /DNA_END=698 /DNA_ORIENTATION=+